MADPDADRWLEELAGRSEPADPLERRRTGALRAAIESQISADRAPPGGGLGLQRLLRKLEAEGLLSKQARLASLGHRRAWKRAVPALAAALLLVLGVLMFRLIGEPTKIPEVERGVAGAVVMLSSDPPRTADETIRTLQARGFKITRVPRTDRVILQLHVSAAQLAEFASWAQANGGRARQPGTYRILIDRREP